MNGPINIPPMTPQLECQHFWSQVGTDGMIVCAWCGKRVQSPITYTDSMTFPFHGDNTP